MRVSYLDAAIPRISGPQPISYLDAAILNLPQCGGVDGFDCCFPGTVRHLAAEEDYCWLHYNFVVEHFVFDPYEIGRLAAPQTLVEWVIEYMRRRENAS